MSIRKSKDRQHNGQKKNNTSTKHTHKTKDRVTRPPLKAGGELTSSGRVAVHDPLVAPVMLIKTGLDSFSAHDIPLYAYTISLSPHGILHLNITILCTVHTNHSRHFPLYHVFQTSLHCNDYTQDINPS